MSRMKLWMSTEFSYMISSQNPMGINVALAVICSFLHNCNCPMIMMSTYIGDIVEQGTTPGIFMSAYEVKLRSHVAWKGDKNGVESLCGFFLPQVTKPPWFYPVG